MRLHFLVQEGQIRAEAVVRHVIAGRGFGVKIESLSAQDAPQMKRLLSRLREHSVMGRLQAHARPGVPGAL